MPKWLPPWPSQSYRGFDKATEALSKAAPASFPSRQFHISASISVFLLRLLSVQSRPPRSLLTNCHLVPISVCGLTVCVGGEGAVKDEATGSTLFCSRDSTEGHSTLTQPPTVHSCLVQQRNNHHMSYLQTVR